MPRVRPLTSDLDPYHILDVGRDATAEQIRRAYRRMLLKAHPDKNPERPEWSERRVRELLQAFEILGDGESRRQYDIQFRLRARADGSDGPVGEARLFFFRKHDPECRALRVVYFLTNGRGREAVDLLDSLERRGGSAFLRRYLDLNDYLDCLFLLGEHFLEEKRFVDALKRFLVLFEHQNAARFKRPYFELTVDALKSLYLRFLPRSLSPRDWLEIIETGDGGVPWTGRERARLLLFSATAHRDLGDSLRAREIARQALRVDPSSRSVRQWFDEAGLCF
jgi:curved DNA-binding protein CbpA